MRLRLKESPENGSSSPPPPESCSDCWGPGWKQWHTLALWAGFIPDAWQDCVLAPTSFRGYYRMGMRFSASSVAAFPLALTLFFSAVSPPWPDAAIHGEDFSNSIAQATSRRTGKAPEAVVAMTRCFRPLPERKPLDHRRLDSFQGVERWASSIRTF